LLHRQQVETPAGDLLAATVAGLEDLDLRDVGQRFLLLGRCGRLDDLSPWRGIVGCLPVTLSYLVERGGVEAGRGQRIAAEAAGGLIADAGPGGAGEAVHGAEH